MKPVIGNLLVLSLVLGAAVYSPPSHAFVTLFCFNSNNPADVDDDDSMNSTALIKEDVIFECSTLRFDLDSSTGLSETHHYFVHLEGFGLGLRGAWFEGATILCPTVRKAALGVDTFVNKKGVSKEGTTEFYGVKASAAALFGGADAAAFMNAKGGMCFLTGVQLVGLGAGVAATRMTVERKY